jgi:hypothetical protein
MNPHPHPDPLPAPRVDQMAGRLALFCSAGLLAFGALAMFGTFGGAPKARAQEPGLPDPTQPPPALLAPKSTDATVAAPAGPVLQSVIISEQRRGAVISGQYVALGGVFRDARLTQVSESGVELRGAGGTQRLELYPAVEWRPVKAKEATPAAAPGGKSTTAQRRREGKGAP